MEYGIVINKAELSVMLCLLNKSELEHVAAVEEDFFPDADLLDTMEEKTFFIRKDTLGWNPFVHFVMTGVCGADCVLRTVSKNGSLCYLYFREDEMFLLTHKAGEEEYCIYFVPFIPKAMGGLSLHYDALREMMKPYSAEEEIGISGEAESMEQLISVLHEELSFLPEDAVPEICIEGEIMGEVRYRAAVIHTEDGDLYASSDMQGITCTAADYYTMIEKIAEWVIAIHGNCICWGNRYE